MNLGDRFRGKMQSIADMFRTAPPPGAPALPPDDKVQGRLPATTAAGAPLPDPERMRPALEAMAARMRGETPVSQVVGTDINPALALDWAKPEPRGIGGDILPAGVRPPPMLPEMPPLRTGPDGRPLAPSRDDLRIMQARVDAEEGGRVIDNSGPAPVVVATPSSGSAVQGAGGGSVMAGMMLPRAGFGSSLPVMAQASTPAPVALTTPAASAMATPVESPLAALFTFSEQQKTRKAIEAAAEKQRRAALFGGPSPFG